LTDEQLCEWLWAGTTGGHAPIEKFECSRCGARATVPFAEVGTGGEPPARRCSGEKGGRTNG